MRLLILGALVSAWSACSSAPLCTSGGIGPGGAGGGLGTAIGSIGLVGTPMNVNFQLAATVTTCGASAASVSGVEVSVLDPTDQKVTATATAPSELDGEVNTTVTFTPLTPGPYHLTVRFEPGMGTMQRDAMVAIDKTVEPAIIVGVPTSPAAVNCQQIDFDGETLVCLDVVNSGSRLRTIRAATLVDSVAASAFGLSNGWVWTFSDVDQSLHVFQLGSTGSLQLLGSFPINLNGQPQILARADRALVIDVNGFVEIRYQAGAGFTASSDMPVASASGGQWVPELGVNAASGIGSVCSYTSRQGQFADAGCVSDSIRVIGYDDDGVWWVDVSIQQPSPTPTLFVSGWQAGQPQPLTGSLKYGTSVLPNSSNGQWTPQATPLLYAGGPPDGTDPTELYLPHFDGQNVVLVRYPFMASGVHADSQRLWFQNADTITWYAR